VIGSAIGVPLGAALLQWTPAAHMLMVIGGALVAFSLYAWFRWDFAAASRAGLIADGAVGMVNGVIGGAPALPGLRRSYGAICAAGRRPSSGPSFSRSASQFSS
jgi:uncharacterized membrane protein YfcA